MNISKDGLNLIKAFEGLHKVGEDGFVYAYKCPAGIWTIGYGHTAGVRAGMKITKDAAERLLADDVASFAADVARLVKRPITQNQFDAFVSLAFNIGVGAFSKSTALREFNAGNVGAVPAAIMRWNKATVNGKKVVLAGLQRRRAAEVSLFTMDAKLGQDEPQPQEVAASEGKPLAKSRTMTGVSLAGFATVASATMQEIADKVDPVKEYSPYVMYGFLILTVLGLALAGYARWDDHRNGARDANA